LEIGNKSITRGREGFFNAEDAENVHGGRRGKLLTAKNAKKGREGREENLFTTRDTKGHEGAA
jgi:hypothetical protein